MTWGRRKSAHNNRLHFLTATNDLNRANDHASTRQTCPRSGIQMSQHLWQPRGDGRSRGRTPDPLKPEITCVTLLVLCYMTNRYIESHGQHLSNPEAPSTEPSSSTFSRCSSRRTSRTRVILQAPLLLNLITHSARGGRVLLCPSAFTGFVNRPTQLLAEFLSSFQQHKMAVSS